MKTRHLHIIFSWAVALVATSCAEVKENNSSNEIDIDFPEHVIINDCIKQAVYYEFKNQSYDSIDTKYFQKIEDYKEEDAIELTILLKSYNKHLQECQDSVEIKSCIFKCDSIKQELSRYSKELVGYVFVHTFEIDKKLNSAIFLIGKSCRWSELIPIKTITEPNVDDYIDDFRGKNQAAQK